jgi:hypothetical protein
MDISLVLIITPLLETLNKLGIISSAEKMKIKGEIIDEMLSDE